MVIEVARHLAGLEGANSTRVRHHQSPPGHRPHGRPAQGRRHGRHHAARVVRGPARARLHGGRRLRDHRWCPNATATATRSTPATAPSSKRPACAARGPRPTACSSNSSSSPATPSGSGPRPTPSSRAAPTVPTRCSGSCWGPRCDRADGRLPRLIDHRRRRRCRLLRTAGSVTSVTRSASRGGGSPSSEAGSRPPTAPRFTRDVVRHPGAVAVVPVTDTRHGAPRAPVPGIGRPRAARDPRRHPRRRGRGARDDGAARARGGGRGARRDHAAPGHHAQQPRVLRPGDAVSTWRSDLEPVEPARHGEEERYIEVVRGRLWTTSTP